MAGHLGDQQQRRRYGADGQGAQENPAQQGEAWLRVGPMEASQQVLRVLWDVQQACCKN